MASVANNGTTYVAVGTTGAIRTSLDGVAWTTRTSNTAETLIKVMWNGTQFVAVGAGGIVLTSPNGTTWTKRASGVNNEINRSHLDW